MHLVLRLRGGGGGFFVKNLLTGEEKMMSADGSSMKILDIRSWISTSFNSPKFILKVDGNTIGRKEILSKVSAYPSIVDGSHVVSFMPVNYKTVVFCQSAAGFWNETILDLLGLKTIQELIDLQTDESIKKLQKEILLTVVGLKILKTSFKENSKEWKLVASKGATYVKKAGLPIALDQLLDLVICSLVA